MIKNVVVIVMSRKKLYDKLSNHLKTLHKDMPDVLVSDMEDVDIILRAIVNVIVAMIERTEFLHEIMEEYGDTLHMVGELSQAYSQATLSCLTLLDENPYTQGLQAEFMKHMLEATANNDKMRVSFHEFIISKMQEDGHSEDEHESLSYLNEYLSIKNHQVDMKEEE